MKKLLKPEYGEHDLELFDAFADERPSQDAYAAALQERIAKRRDGGGGGGGEDAEVSGSSKSGSAASDSEDRSTPSTRVLESRVSWRRCFRAAAAMLPPVLLPATVARAAGVATATAVKSTPGGLTLSFLLGLPGLVLLGVLLVCLLGLRLTRAVSAERLEVLAVRPTQLRRVREKAKSRMEPLVFLPLIGVVFLRSPEWSLIAPAFLVVPYLVWRRSRAGLAEREILTRDMGIVMGLVTYTTAAVVISGAISILAPLICFAGVLLTIVVGYWHLGWRAAVTELRGPFNMLALLLGFGMGQGPGFGLVVLACWFGIRALLIVLQFVLRSIPQAVAYAADPVLSVVGVCVIWSLGTVGKQEAADRYLRRAFERAQEIGVADPGQFQSWPELVEVLAASPGSMDAEVDALRARMQDTTDPGTLWKLLQLGWVSPADCAERLPVPTLPATSVEESADDPTSNWGADLLARVCDQSLDASEKRVLADRILAENRRSSLASIDRMETALHVLGQEGLAEALRPKAHALLSGAFRVHQRSFQDVVEFRFLRLGAELAAIRMMAKYGVPDEGVRLALYSDMLWWPRDSEDEIKRRYLDALLSEEVAAAEYSNAELWRRWLPVALATLMTLLCVIVVRRTPVVSGVANASQA